jgi:hypothetical protein
MCMINQFDVCRSEATLIRHVELFVFYALLFFQSLSFSMF